MRNYDVDGGFKGSKADSNPTTTINTVAEQAVQVGSFVELTANGVNPLSGVGKVGGFVAKSDAIQDDTVEAGQSVTLVTKGSFYANSQTAVVANAKVFVVHTATGTESVGDVRADANTDKAEEINATFAHTADSGIVKININL